MSDTEPVVLREQPPVEHPIERRERWSQTFLKYADRCLRSAYLYERHRGGPGSHALHRGTAFHLFAEKATWHLLEHGEERLPPEVAKDLMREVLMENPHLQIPQGEQDSLRFMAWHWAEGVWLRHEQTIAVEGKFVLDVGRWRVSGKVDYAWLDGARCGVWDYKTTMAIPDQAEFEGGFQLPLYACGIAFGRLVREEPCEVCGGDGKDAPMGEPDDGERPCVYCDGRGKIEHLEPWPIAENAQEFEIAELYPAYLWESGIGQRVTTLSRADLLDWMQALEVTLNRVEHAYESGRWDAVNGHHCGECPAPWECPLPKRVRNYAGAINSMEQASEAATWWDFQAGRTKAVREEIKRFANLHGPVRFGKDLVLEFKSSEKRSTDVDGLVDAAVRHAEFGEPFDPSEFVTVKQSINFGKRRLKKAELSGDNNQEVSDGAGDDGAAGDGGARFGDEPPF